MTTFLVSIVCRKLIYIRRFQGKIQDFIRQIYQHNLKAINNYLKSIGFHRKLHHASSEKQRRLYQILKKKRIGDTRDNFYIILFNVYSVLFIDHLIRKN